MSEDTVALSEYAEVNPESTAAKPTTYRFRYVDLSSVKRGTIDYSSLQEHDLATAPSRARRVVQRGDFLFGNVRPQLRSHAQLNEDGPLVASTGFTVVRPRKERANGRFLGHFLLSDEAARQAAALETGSSYPAVTQRDVEGFRLPLLELNEQRRIAEILDTIDEAIQATERVIEKESRCGAGLADSLFKAHFPSKRLGEISRRITYGYTNPMPETKTGPWMLTAADIGYGWINFSTARRTSEYAFQNALTGKSRPSENDVLITKDGTLGRVAVLGSTAVCVNQSVAVLTPREPDDSSYLADYLLTSTGQKAMLADAGGSTIRHLYISNLGKLQIPWPDEQIRIEITSILSASRGQLKASAAHVATLKRVRAGLAADLLSGRVRTVVS